MTDAEYDSNVDKMSRDQQQVLHALQQYVSDIRAGNQPEPLRCVITGGAGVSKSFVISRIKEILDLCDGSRTLCF